MKTLVSESVFNKQTTPVKQFDVVRVTSLRKCEIPNKEGLWVAMLAAPTEILVSSLTKSLGSPQDIMTIDAELAG
jgi:replication factor A1